MNRIVLSIMMSLGLAHAAFAQSSPDPAAKFTKGPIFESYGENAPVPGMSDLPTDTVYKLSFDIAKPAEAGAINRAINSPARFVNMHARAGVPVDNISVALVIHGKAAFDVTHDAFYNTARGVNPEGLDNATAPLVTALIRDGHRVILCGQSAQYHGISKADLIDGVELSLSAMTAHVLLQQDGYAINPF